MNTKAKIKRASVLFITCLLLAARSFAQSVEDSTAEDDDVDIVSSIAPYPDVIRDAILDVSQYPQRIVKIERIQTRTSQSFQDMVAEYPRDIQEKMYELSRYPDLISQLVENENNGNDQVKLKEIIATCPKQITSTVNELYPAYTSVLQFMDKKYKHSQQMLKNITADLPIETQRNFEKVIARPDVMSLLTDRIDLTVSLGEAYRNNPEAIKASLDSLNGNLSAQNTKDLDSYKKKVEDDPELQAEMKKSAKDFANYTQTTDTTYNVVNNYYYGNNNSYPYWFGYPYWYSSPVWYPSPLYYYTGFYIGPQGNLVVVGLPSYAYSNWFFNYGYNNYPRLYRNYKMFYNNYPQQIRHHNIYRGFNTAAREHFARNNHISNSTNWQGQRQGMNRQGNMNMGNNRRNNMDYRGNRDNNNRSQQFHNSIYQNNNNFNNQGVQHFNSQQFHQQGWNNFGGGRGGGFGGGFGGHSGGGGRHH